MPLSSGCRIKFIIYLIILLQVYFCQNVFLLGKIIICVQFFCYIFEFNVFSWYRWIMYWRIQTKFRITRSSFECLFKVLFKFMWHQYSDKYLTFLYWIILKYFFSISWINKKKWYLKSCIFHAKKSI